MDPVRYYVGQWSYMPFIISFAWLKDLFIGNTVTFCKHPFVLIDCDEYAIRYMEAHPQLFPQANIKSILPKLAQLTSSAKDEFKQFLDANGEHSSFEELRWTKIS